LALKSLIKYFTLLATANLLYCDIGDLSLLKQKSLELEKKINQKSSTNQKYSWIKPIIASYSYSKSDQFSIKNRSRYFRISIEQPIFKSGGIYFAIKYSDANREFKEILRSLKEKNLIKKLYKRVIEIQKIDLNIKKSKLEIANANIDIKRKKEQFDAGIIDSSFLDTALLKKDAIKSALVDLKSKKDALLMEFKTLSDKDYKDIKLPTFHEISKDEFIKKNIELQKFKTQSHEARYLKDITISSYLPTISLFGEYSNKDDSYKLFKAQAREYKNYGIRVSMPILDINMLRKIEVDKLKYLKSKIDLLDKQKEVAFDFDLFKRRLTNLKRKLKIAKDSIKSYTKLIENTKDGLKAGEKSRLDLKNLQNSKNISKLDLMIIKKDINLLYLDLFTKMSDEI